MFPTTQKRHVIPFGSNSQGCIHLLKIFAGITSGIGYVHGGVVNETRYSSAHGGGRRNCLLAQQAQLYIVASYILINKTRVVH
jgi:hypothetical protein